ncbi:MAG: c-type cytochrome [Planctomycetaceae bacterium]
MSARLWSLGWWGCLASLAGASVAFSADKVADRRYEQRPEISPVVGKPAVAEPSTPAGDVLKQGPNPDWIWGPDDNQNPVVRKKFTTSAKKGWLKASCDNRAVIEIHGRKVGETGEWAEPIEVNVSAYLREGENLLTAALANDGGPAAFVLKLALVEEDGKVTHVVTDGTWEFAPRKDAETWAATRKIGPLGMAPWGNVFLNASGAGAAKAEFRVPAGFRVERLFTVPKDELGSWVCLTRDPKGRLLVSDQEGKGLCRITPSPIGSQEPTRVEHLAVNITAAQGMLWAFDSLYVVCNGGPGSGLYRVRDTNGDDQLDEVVKLKEFRGGGEHGPHAVRLTPDGKSLVVIGGNHTLPPFDPQRNAAPQIMAGARSEPLSAKPPEGMSSRLPTNWDEDLLLPRQWDANGHATGLLAPGGWIAQTDPEGKSWEIISSGYRNQYDMAFNADGELFVYDADMEWDYGSPWYRPTRVSHATSGSEFGWRSGTGKWPTYYPDSLPPLVNIGPGSPVGVEFGYGTRFPAKYQKALYICDWTFGTMYAIHIEPEGSSYKAVKEEFVSRSPLPLTDNTVGIDGALYFTIGGRGTQSELYRVTYAGKESTAPANAHDEKGADLRSVRRKIEAAHRLMADPKAAVEQVWPYLSHSDRFIAYAARVALENQPVDLWRDKVLQATNTDALIVGAIALARQGDKGVQPALLSALNRLKFTELSTTQQLGLLRAWQLCFIRLGQPDETTRKGLAERLGALYPARDPGVTRELCTLLVFLQSPEVVAKTLPLLAQEPTHAVADPGNQIAPVYVPGQPVSQGGAKDGLEELIERNRGYGGAIASMLANRPDAQQIALAFSLRNLKTGWTVDQKREYFQWYSKAQKWSGGASFQGFLRNMDKDAYENSTDVERLAIEALGARKPYQPPELPKPAGPGKDWKRDEVLQLISTQLKGRDFKNGQKTFSSTRCVVCHRFGGDGGATGPDLTQLAGRFTPQDLADAILEPSKVISDQYKAVVVETKDGKTHTGRLVGDNGKVIRLVTDPEDSSKTVEIAKDQIEEQQLSATSLMPADLLKPLNESEVLDQFAYLLSRGNPNDPVFRK